MKTCTVCGRGAPDAAAQCPYDGGDLVAGEPEETQVRPRPAQPAPPRFTVEDISRPTAPASHRVPAPPRPAAPPAVERPVWPAAVAIAVAAAIGVAALVYYLYSERTREVDAINTQVADARIAVADAKARIESLPVENPLRQKIITLDKWDRELQGFLLSQERSPEMAARARDILREAEQISDAARSAGATLSVKPVVPPATTEEPKPPEGAAPATEPSPDGAGGSQGGTSPGEPPPAEDLPKPGGSEPKPAPPSPGSNSNSTAPGGHPLPPPPSPPPPSNNTARPDNTNRGGETR